MSHSMKSWFPTFRKLSSVQTPFHAWWPSYTTLTQRRSLLRLIAVATEEHLPLGPLIEAWAADERGVQVSRLRRLARLLAEGTPLASAIEQAPGGLGDEDVLAIRFGAQSGTLAAAVRGALDDSQARPTSRASLFRRTIIYFCAVSLIGLLIVAFVQVKIVPVINKILADFSVQPPEMFQRSQQLASIVTGFWWLGVLMVLGLLWSAFSARPGRFIRHVIFGRLFRSLQELRSAEVLQKLSVATHAGRPIPGALSTLARYHFDPLVRHKLLFVRNEVEQGAELWQSMTATGLLTPPEAELMKSADRVGNRSWALRQLAAGKRRRTLRRLDRLSELFLPAVVLAMGTFVLFHALMIFLPLMKLIVFNL
jgi:general secretion pathway protein F